MKQLEKQHWYRKIRRDFLLSFFDNGNEYQEKAINGFYLIKQFNSMLLDWEVAVYTKSSYSKRKSHKTRIHNLLKSRRNKQKRVK